MHRSTLRLGFFATIMVAACAAPTPEETPESAILAAGGTPDLIVTALTWSPSADPGAKLTFTATLKNNGTAATPAGTDIGVGFRIDGVSLPVSWSTSTTSLAAGATRVMTAQGGPNGVAWWELPSGHHTVAAWVDDQGLIAESNDGNNTLTKNLGSKDLGVQNGWVFGMADTPLNERLDQAQAMGAKIFRLDVAWTDIETSQNTFNWAWLDGAVNKINTKNMEPLFIIDTAPGWARVGGAGAFYWRPPIDPTTFGTFAGKVSQRYANATYKVHLFEIWNEPNNGTFWGDLPVEPWKYAQMACDAYTKIKNNAATPTIVMAGAGAPWGKYIDHGSGDGLYMNPVYFLEQAYASNGSFSNCFDAYSHHPYSYGQNFTSAQMLAVNDWSAWSQMADYTGAPSLRTLMSSHSAGGKKIWATEVGAPTGSCSECTSEANQAAYVTAAIDKWRTYSWSGGLLWYNARDNGTDPANKEHNFGLLRYDSTLKPGRDNFLNKQNPQ